jgi:hypothetical protein
MDIAQITVTIGGVSLIVFTLWFFFCGRRRVQGTGDERDHEPGLGRFEFGVAKADCIDPQPRRDI